ncbi:MAG: DUF1464 family protein [Fervidicoccaceae archaeon]
MVRSLGIDPGTKSFDLVIVEDGEVVWEDSIATEKVAENPEKLTEELIRFEKEVDIIVGPSGYGAPYICNEDIIDPKLFASEILLLTSANLLRKKEEDLGFAVYRAIYKLVGQLWKKKLNVCYIPSVKQLGTVDLSFKINKIDLGTADKLASTFLGAYILKNSTENIKSKKDFLLLELGFGYNALIHVKDGVIYGGLGGTSLGPGFITPGPIDLELVVAGKWKRNSVWSGGINVACNGESMSEVFTKEENRICASYVKTMISSIRSGLTYLEASNDETIIVSGRWADIDVVKTIEEILGVPIFVSRPKLKGATFSKEAAQGMAMLGDAMLRGRFSSLFGEMRLNEAKGTVMDHIYIPALKPAIMRHVEAYRRSIKAEKVNEILESSII